MRYMPAQPPLQSQDGFTILELMITMAIVILVTAIGFISMSGYLPKQRLITTAKYLETALQRTQSEAYSRSTRAGLRLRAVGGRILMRPFLDANGNYVQDVSELRLSETAFRDNVVPIISSNSSGGCSSINGPATPCNCTTTACDCYIFFDSSGQAVDGSAGATQGQPIDYEIFIHSKQLEVGGTADREIEVLSSGLVQVVRQGQAGNASGGRCVQGCATVECYATTP